MYVDISLSVALSRSDVTKLLIDVGVVELMPKQRTSQKDLYYVVYRKDL